MLIKAAREITKISDDEKINSENYIESLSYIDALYRFINLMKLEVAIKDITFMATFKGFHTCEKFGISSTEFENDMRHLIIKSKLFSEDKVLRENIKLRMGKICESIFFEDDTIEFNLR